MSYYDHNLLEIADKRRQLEEHAALIINTYGKNRQKDTPAVETRPTIPTLTSSEKQRSKAVTPTTPTQPRSRPIGVQSPATPIEQDYESDPLPPDDRQNLPPHSPDPLERNPPDERQNLSPHPLPNTNVKLEELLVKQGKQICALYQMQKSTNEKLVWLQNHFKKQDENKNNDLSQKVFSVS